MKNLMALTIVAVIVIASITARAQSEHLIDVGNGRSALVGTVQWSPDGSTVAFFRNRVLLLSDTLGVIREVGPVPYPPHSYMWLSNHEVLIDQWQRQGNGSDFSQLIVVDVDNATVTVLAEWERRREFYGKGNPASYSSPQRTLDGHPFFLTNTWKTKLSREPAGIRFPESKYADKMDSTALMDKEFLAWGEDALYRVRCDLKDSVAVSPKPGLAHFLPTLSPDLKMWVLGGRVYDMDQDVHIVIDTAVHDFLPNTGAVDFLHSTFHPVKDQVLTNIIFHDGDNYESVAVAVVQLNPISITIIDSIIGLDQCERPTFSPDGSKIALESDGNVFIWKGISQIKIAPKLSGIALAQSTEDTILVDACIDGPIHSAVRWSPNGSLFAYFRGSSLMVGDTLGAVIPVGEVAHSVSCFNWVSDEAVVVAMRGESSSGGETFRIEEYRLAAGQTILEEETVTDSGDLTFRFPRESIEGAVYYRSYVKSDNSAVVLSQDKNGRAIAASNLHYLDLVGDNVCKISLDLSDTTIVLPGRYSGYVTRDNVRQIISRDENSGLTVVWDVPSGICDTLPVPALDVPDSLDCGVSDYKFHPTDDRIIYLVSCDDGHFVSVDFVCSFDLDSHRVRVHGSSESPLTWNVPAYSPDGRFSCHVSTGLYLVREGVQ
jgi:hypothetical protein